ncbi:hypothetical protein Tco_0423930 [Tanacetum coccineum]
MFTVPHPVLTETKDTLSSCSKSEKQQMQQVQDKAKESCMTFTGTMFLNVDKLEKQLDKEDFQEIGSMATFRVLKTQFHKFINSQFSLDDDDGLMTRKYFLAYTQIEVQQFHDTLIQHMESVKKSIDERALHKREYDIRVNERHYTSSRSGNDAYANNADIKHVYDEEPMAEVQLTAEYNVFAIGQQHAEQPEFNNE